MSYSPSLSTIVIAIVLSGTSAAAQQLNIKQLIDGLIQCQPELRLSAAQVETSQLEIELAASQKLPSFSITANGFSQGGKSTGLAQMELSAPIYTFGKQDARESIAESEVSLAHARFNQTVSERVSDLLSAVALRESLNNRLQILTDTYQSEMTYADQVRRRRDAGSVSSADVIKIEASLAQIQGQVNDLQFEISQETNRILNLGCPQYDFEVLPEQIVMELSSYAGSVKRNPQLIEAIMSLRNAQEITSLERISNRPSLDLEISNQIGTSGRAEPRIGLTTGFEYQNLGRNRNLRLNERLLEEEQRMLEIQNIESKAVINYETKQKQIELLSATSIPSLAQTIDVLDSQLASTTRLYDAGRAPISEVLTNHGELMRARLDLEEARFTIQSIQIEIYTLLGGMVQE